MKKTLLKALALGCVTSLMMVCSASATTLSYNDTTIGFPGETNIYPADDDYGTPEISGIDVEYDETTWDADGNFLLKTVTVFMETRRTYDTLMINDGQEGEWNSWDYYVVDQWGGDSGAHDPSYTEDGFYTVDDDTAPRYATVGRIGHISGLEGGDPTGALEPLWDGAELVYDFSGFNIMLNLESFVMGYTPYCANDVILANTPVPEPATMLLFGTGLVGLVGVSRRRKKQA